MPYVLAVGRQVRQKGFDVLLEAMAILVRGTDISTSAAPRRRRPRRAALERLAQELGLGDRVRFLGATDREQIASLFRGADLFVLPSRHEPFGIVNLEAMAAGVPVVATEVGGVPEFVIDGKTGILVRPDDAGELANAMSRLLADRALRDSCVDNGAEVAAEHDWSVLADQYIDVYRSVLRRPESRRLDAMKVLIWLNGSVNFGGHEVQLTELIPELVVLGVDVEFTEKDPESLHPIDVVHGLGLTAEQVRTCRRAGLPVVLSTVYWSTSYTHSLFRFREQPQLQRRLRLGVCARCRGAAPQYLEKLQGLAARLEEWRGLRVRRPAPAQRPR